MTSSTNLATHLPTRASLNERRSTSLTRIGLVVATAVVASTSVLGASVMFDLRNDWSDSQNPNGHWAYEDPFGGRLIPTIRATDAWGVPQASFGDLPGVFKSNGTEQFPHGWLGGDVVAHTDPGGNFIAVKWTANQPFENVSFEVDLWSGRNSGRETYFLIGSSLLGYLGGGVLRDSDSHDRSNPIKLTANTGSLPANQNFFLAIVENGPAALVNEDYVGINMRVSGTVVPEPTTWSVVAGVGLMAFAVWRRLRRSSAPIGDPTSA